MVYMPRYTTLVYMPRYTTLVYMPSILPWIYTTFPHAVTGLHHGYTGTLLRGEEALGSVEEESHGWESLSLLRSSKV